MRVDYFYCKIRLIFTQMSNNFLTKTIGETRLEKVIKIST